MMFQQMIRFGFVGMIATLVHVIVGMTLVHSGWQPLKANALAFVIAFSISFMGHVGFSFADQQHDLWTALRRYALVALCGFALNEALLAALLSFTTSDPMFALFLATAFSATVTYFLSRIWAFRLLVSKNATGWDGAQ